MKTIGIFEVKTHLSDICDQVSKTREPVLVTRRGVPIVRIDPLTVDDNTSKVWEARSAYITSCGDIDEDLILPGRDADDYHNPFDE